MISRRVRFLSGKELDVTMPEKGLLCHEIVDYILKEYETVFGESLREHRVQLSFNNGENDDLYDLYIFMNPPQKMYIENGDELVYTIDHKEDLLDSIDYLRENVEKDTSIQKQLIIKMQENIFDHKGLNWLDSNQFKIFLDTVNEWYLIDSFTFFPKGIRNRDITDLLLCCNKVKTLAINFYLDPSILVHFPNLERYEIRKEAFISITQDWMEKVSKSSVKQVVIDIYFDSNLISEEKGIYYGWSYEKNRSDIDQSQCSRLYLTRL